MSQPNRLHLWRHCRAPIYSAGCVSWGCDSSYPGEGERTTFESSLKKGWIKHNSFWQTCLLWYAEEVSGISVWGKSWRWWLWGCYGGVRTACSCSAWGPGRGGVFCSPKKQASGPFLELVSSSLTMRIHSFCHISVTCSRTVRHSGGLLKRKCACSGDRDPVFSLFPHLSQAQLLYQGIFAGSWLWLCFPSWHVCILLFKKHSSLQITSFLQGTLCPLITVLCEPVALCRLVCIAVFCKNTGFYLNLECSLI